MKKLLGTVVSDKMQNAAVVLVESSWRHPLYKKIVKRSKKFLVRNAVGAKAGNSVEITESRPLSGKIRFVITKVNKKI